MTDKHKPTVHQRWALLRFSVVGSLLAAPPAHSELQLELKRLAAKSWEHAVTGRPTRFGLSTIQRWYYLAKAARTDPVGVLRRKVRKDLGEQPSVTVPLKAALLAQYAAHKNWSYQLHTDNLAVLVEADSKQGPMPSYSTIRRLMKVTGLTKRRRLSSKETAGALKAEQRLDERRGRKNRLNSAAPRSLSFCFGVGKAVQGCVRGDKSRWEAPFSSPSHTAARLSEVVKRERALTSAYSDDADH